MILAEIVTPRSYGNGVAALLAQYCADVGGELVGRSACSQREEMLFVVALKEKIYLDKHVSLLKKALRDQTISSLDVVEGNLVKLSGNDLGERIADFPLALDDCWVPAVQEQEAIHLCIQRWMLTPKQAAWLLLHPQVHWNYL